MRCLNLSLDGKHDMWTYLVLNSVKLKYWNDPCCKNEILAYMVTISITMKIELVPWFKTWYLNLCGFKFGKIKLLNWPFSWSLISVWNCPLIPKMKMKMYLMTLKMVRLNSQGYLFIVYDYLGAKSVKIRIFPPKTAWKTCKYQLLAVSMCGAHETTCIVVPCEFCSFRPFFKSSSVLQCIRTSNNFSLLLLCIIFKCLLRTI